MCRMVLILMEWSKESLTLFLRRQRSLSQHIWLWSTCQLHGWHGPREIKQRSLWAVLIGPRPSLTPSERPLTFLYKLDQVPHLCIIIAICTINAERGSDCRAGLHSSARSTENLHERAQVVVDPPPLLGGKYWASWQHFEGTEPSWSSPGIPCELPALSSPSHTVRQRSGPAPEGSPALGRRSLRRAAAHKEQSPVRSQAWTPATSKS